MDKKLEYIAKSLGDISKLVLGVGAVSKMFSPESLQWSNLTLALLLGVGMFTVGVILQPGR